MLKHALQQQHRCKTSLILICIEKDLTSIDHLRQALENVQDGNREDGACQVVSKGARACLSPSSFQP